MNLNAQNSPVIIKVWTLPSHFYIFCPWTKASWPKLNQTEGQRKGKIMLAFRNCNEKIVKTGEYLSWEMRVKPKIMIRLKTLETKKMVVSRNGKWGEENSLRQKRESLIALDLRQWWSRQLSSRQMQKLGK